MRTYVICPKCAGDDLELVFEHDTADDGEWWNLIEANCLNDCDFTFEEFEKLAHEHEVTMEQVNDYYEPDFTDIDKYQPGRF